MTRTLYRGTTEYLEVTVSSDVDLTGIVEVSFDRETWAEAEWVGDVGPTRTARFLVTPENLPEGSYADVFVRFTDSPEMPMMNGGRVAVS